MTMMTKLGYISVGIIQFLIILVSLDGLTTTTTTTNNTKTSILFVTAGAPSPFECRSDYDCNLDSDGSDASAVKRDCIFVFDNDIKNASYCSSTALHDTLSQSMFTCQNDDDCRYGNCIFTRDSETNRTIASTCFCNPGFMGANCQNRCTAKCIYIQ